MMASATELQSIEQMFAPIALSLPRLLAVFLVAPFLSPAIVNGFTRNGIILILAIFLSPMIGELPPLAIGTWVLIAAKEAFVGVLLGLGFGIFIWAVESVGDLIDFQTGSANAPFFHPVGGHEGGPTGDFLSRLVITLFVVAGGLTTVVAVLIDSFRLWPVASFFPNVGQVLEQFVIQQGDTLFLWIVKLGAPVIFILLLVELGLGLVGRVAPQLNVFVFSQPLKSLLANLMLLLFLYFLYDSLLEFLRPQNGLLDLLRNAL